MQRQEIIGVKLTLESWEGIKPLCEYMGRGRLSKDSSGFLFKENPQTVRVRNMRVAKTGENCRIMRMRKSGKFMLTLELEDDEMTLKAITAKVRPLLAQAKEGGWV